MEESWTPEDLARAYLARGDWRRSRAPGPPPRTRTLSVWDGWLWARVEAARGTG